MKIIEKFSLCYGVNVYNERNEKRTRKDVNDQFNIQFGYPTNATTVAHQTFRFHWDARKGEHFLVNDYYARLYPAHYNRPARFDSLEIFVDFAKAFLDREGNRDFCFVGLPSRVEFRRGRWCWKK